MPSSNNPVRKLGPRMTRQRQAGGEQKQHETKLQAVEGLLKNQLGHFILHCAT